jgi:N6-adenosine-specific RNA methylase IME4
MFDALSVPPGGFKAIMADPPWAFKGYAPPRPQNFASDRGVTKHYQTMTREEICAMPMLDIAARDCHLFLWSTGPHLPQALETMDRWGFKYSGMGFVWVKMRRAFATQPMRMLPLIQADLFMGLGHTTRKNAEYVLLGRRGNARRMAKDVHEIILAPVREHSRKPDEAFARVQRYCEGPYAEIFSREERAGWSTWGNEQAKFNGGATA